MKKLFALLLALVMMMSLVACGPQAPTEPSKPALTNPTNPAPTNPAPTNPAPTNPAPTDPQVNLPESTVALLNELFNAIPEEKRYVIDVETGEYYLDENGEKMANFNGGSFLLDEEGIPYYPGVNAAGTIDLTQEYALFSLFVPDDSYASVEEAASLFHGMNANFLTSGALKLKEGTDVAALAQAIRDALANNWWMCGSPDRFVVASVGDYLFVIYGHDGAGDENYANEILVTPMVNALTEKYSSAQILFDEKVGI